MKTKKKTEDKFERQTSGKRFDWPRPAKFADAFLRAAIVILIVRYRMRHCSASIHFKVNNKNEKNIFEQEMNMVRRTFTESTLSLHVLITDYLSWKSACKHTNSIEHSCFETVLDPGTQAQTLEKIIGTIWIVAKNCQQSRSTFAFENQMISDDLDPTSWYSDFMMSLKTQSERTQARLRSKKTKKRTPVSATRSRLESVAQDNTIQCPHYTHVCLAYPRDTGSESLRDRKLKIAECTNVQPEANASRRQIGSIASSLNSTFSAASSRRWRMSFNVGYGGRFKVLLQVLAVGYGIASVDFFARSFASKSHPSWRIVGGS